MKKYLLSIIFLLAGLFLASIDVEAKNAGGRDSPHFITPQHYLADISIPHGIELKFLCQDRQSMEHLIPYKETKISNLNSKFNQRSKPTKVSKYFFRNSKVNMRGTDSLR